MKLDIEHDRPAHLLMLADPNLSLDEARIRLDRAALVVSVGDEVISRWAQAALLTIAECAVQMFRGGVYILGKLDQTVTVGCQSNLPLGALLKKVGCRSDIPPAHATSLHVGRRCGNDARLRCWTDGWLATVSSKDAADILMEGNEISGAAAGAMAVTEAFRIAVLNDIRAGRRTQKFSPLTPSSPRSDEMPLDLLPSQCWILGLGNLGQATLWILSLLPYANCANVRFLLHDVDESGPENLDTQILTKFDWVGRKKTRAAADWAAARGFQTTITEREFSGHSIRELKEPGLAFVGVDNLPTRRFAARCDASFDLVIDAGLGSSASEIFDLRVHGFPGARTPESAWPHLQKEAPAQIPSSLLQLINEGRLDRCGATMIAGQSLGVPSTAVVAATIQVAQACRAIAQSRYCDLVDLSLIDTRRVYAHETTLQRAGIIPFEEARRAKV